MGVTTDDTRSRYAVDLNTCSGFQQWLYSGLGERVPVWEEGEKERGRKGGRGSRIPWQSPWPVGDTRARGEQCRLRRRQLSRPSRHAGARARSCREGNKRHPRNPNQSPKSRPFFRGKVLFAVHGEPSRGRFYSLQKSSPPLSPSVLLPQRGGVAAPRVLAPSAC